MSAAVVANLGEKMRTRLSRIALYPEAHSGDPVREYRARPRCSLFLQFRILSQKTLGFGFGVEPGIYHLGQQR